MCSLEADTAEVFSTICAQLFPGDSGVLALINESQSSVYVAASWGAFSSALPDSECFDDEQDISQSLALDETTGPCHRRCLYAGCPPKTMVDCFCLPVVTTERTIGVVSVFACPGELNHALEAWPHVIAQKRQTMRRVIEHYSLALENLRLRERLRLESIHDPLTGLYNRRYMEESLTLELNRACRQQTTTAVLMLDVDHFKSFNDTYGHEAGDMVLQALGALLQRNSRSCDIACRYGGEEFLLILPDTSLAAAAQRADEFLKQIRRLRLTHQNSSFQITASIGVAVFPEHAREQETLIRAADEALYRAKERGRDQVQSAIF
jgi:diguanylate cyclase (GGDEF)-like protein